jgi:mono/diheme cytochrome c family protein
MRVRTSSTSAPRTLAPHSLAPLLAALLAGHGAAQDADPAVAVRAVALGAQADATFTDLRWQPRRLGELGACAATVVFFATIDCPIVKRYLPRIGELARELADRGVVVLVVNTGPGDALVDAAGQVALAAPAAVFGKDFDGSFARAFGVDRTAAAVVLDGARRIAYRGRVDDQYGYTGARGAPSRPDLRAAVDDVLAGRPVAVAETAVAGCRITWPEAVLAAASPAVAPVFTRDVLPILQRRCQECHRANGQAPFALVAEADVRKHSAMIVEVAEQGRMPPWYGDSRHGEFVNHRVLPPEERATLAAWVRGGMPSGDSALAPPPVAWPDGAWRLGEPDLVLEIKAPIRLPADGAVPYKYFILPYHFEHDTWVEALEIKPENPRVLHHCNLARVKLGEKFSQDGFITGYVPGGDPMVLDPGTAVRIPAGSALALQAHYVTTGEPEQDRIKVGLRFPRTTVQKELKVTIVADFKFEIPPGARAHPVAAARTIRDDALGIGMFVHMHTRGRDMHVRAVAPDGSEESLLLVPNYNFDWQQSYRWSRTGKPFAKGTRIHALAHYDNSAFNPFNPDPTVAVRFGQETTDEMMYAFVFWVARDEALGLQVDPANGRVLAAAAHER